MPNANLKFFALRYLDDWCADDHRFHFGVQPDKERSERLAALRKAAAYYKVARTLKGCGTEEGLGCVLEELDKVVLPETDDAVDNAVCRLADAFHAKFGKYAVSAASKFLWVRCRSPIVIYDGRAVECLWANGGTFAVSDYPAYRKEWHKQFAERERGIASACSDLARVREFTLADEMPDSGFAELTSSRWFRERVFDKFLWWNAGT